MITSRIKRIICFFERFDDIRIRGGTVELLVKWIGFDDAESYWVHIPFLVEYVPVLISEYLQEVKKADTPRQRDLVQDLK